MNLPLFPAAALLIAVDDAAVIAVVGGGVSAIGSILTWFFGIYRRPRVKWMRVTLSDGRHLSVDQGMEPEEIAEKVKAINANLDDLANGRPPGAGSRS